MNPRRVIVPAITSLVLLAGCAASDAGSTVDNGTAATTVITTDSTESAVDAEVDAGEVDVATQDIAVTFDDAEYQAMLATYSSTGDKEWIEATVTIDGSTYEQVGLRLKGNSSLRSVSTSADPATLPWLIDLDQFVDGQQHDGVIELVVRSNGTTTSLNEAVALELLSLAGLASQDATATAFSVNGGDAVLRLVVDHPDDVWMADELDGSGALYKAESSGDYSYRGDDPEAYDEVFDQEAGDENADLTPLIEFLDFVNNSDDAIFESELAEHLDIDAFATYLAMEELLQNFDDIDGPGNNSYLYYDTATEQFTIVPWDHNLAFGVGMAGAGGMPPGNMPAGQRPTGGAMPGGMPGGVGGGAPGAGGPMGRSNTLVQRFLAVDTWQSLVDARVEELRAELFDSGVAAELLAQWADVIASTGLVDQSTIDSDAATISAAIG